MKLLIVISALSITPACGKKHHKSDAVHYVWPVMLTGAVDDFLKGLWVGPCQAQSNGSRRLTYRFEEKGLVVDEETDLLHGGCEKPSIQTTYRFQTKLGTWNQDLAFVRTVSGKLLQVITRSNSEQLTRQYNRDFLCGLDDWKTGVDRDITGLSCLDQAMAWTDPVEFNLNVLVKRVGISLSASVPALNRLFQPGVTVELNGGRDLGVQYWNNEIPELNTVDYEVSAKLEGLPLMEGEGDFQLEGIPYYSFAKKAIFKNGTVTFRVSVPQTMPAQPLAIAYGYFTDKKTDKLVSFTYRADRKLYEFANYAEEKKDWIEFATLPTQQISIGFTDRAGSDREAPKTEVLTIPDTIKQRKSFEMRLRATDDVSGIHQVALAIDQISEDHTYKGAELATKLVYEGHSIYRATFTLENYGKTRLRRVIGVSTTDRTGRVSNLVPLDIAISD